LVLRPLESHLEDRPPPLDLATIVNCSCDLGKGGMYCSVLNLFRAAVRLDLRMENGVGGVRAFGVPPIRSIDGGTPSFRLFGWFPGGTPPRLSSATLTPLAALLLWLLLLPGILPALAFAFAFALLTSTAGLLFFFGGKEPWVVEVISGVKFVALVPGVASSSGVVDVFPGTSQHGGCQYCRGG